MVTMKEISAQAGVSVSAVSLVLNNRDKGRIKPRVAAQIRQVARDLGYRPNLMARSLKTSHTHILGFLSKEVATTPYAGPIILGAQDAASQYGYVIMTVSADDPRSSEETEISALERYGVDGFFLAEMSNRKAHVPPSLQNYPTVLVNATDGHPVSSTTPKLTRHTGIAPDERLIGYDATMRLIHAGCTRIAYVGCSEPMLAEGLRLEGYKEALREAGLPFDSSLVTAVLNNGPALHSVRELIETQQPDGIFCFNDARAWYVYDTTARLGLTIGKDISVVGVDNHRIFAETLEPQLSTVELPHYEMGYWAACKLISMIEPERELDFSTSPRPLRATLPPLDSEGDVLIHCSLVDKNSVITQ